MGEAVQHCSELSRQVAAATISDLRVTLRLLDLSIRVDPTSITGSFSSAVLLQAAGLETDNVQRITFSVAVHRAWFGHEARLRLDPQTSVPNQTDQRLVEVIARSFAARERLLTMSYDDVAVLPINQLRHLQRVARLSYLDPRIVRSVVEGTQPSHLSARSLWRQEKLPASWADQRVALSI